MNRIDSNRLEFLRRENYVIMIKIADLEREAEENRKEIQRLVRLKR